MKPRLLSCSPRIRRALLALPMVAGLLSISAHAAGPTAPASGAGAGADAPAHGGAASQPGRAAPKVLRYAFRVAETGFDPAQISDLYSRIVVANMLEAPLAYDYLARPAKVVPRTAAALPEASDDFKRWVFRISPGIFFTDDPAFKGQRRELTAADYVYSIKRHYDPVHKSPSLFQLEGMQILGLGALRQKALQSKQPFDYDSEAEGLRVLDRYSFELRLAAPAPRLPYVFADAGTMGAVAREVIEAYPGKAMEHPVGTGAFRLARWARASRIVLERNPGYREEFFDAQPAADDATGQAILARLKGRRLPMVDRVEVSIIDENQPRWLAYLNGEHDMLDRLPEDFSGLAVPNGRLAPHLVRKGIQMERVPAVDATFTFFNVAHPLVGGLTPDKVALRRALALSYDSQAEIDLVRRGQAIVAQSLLPPMVSGHDATLRTEMSEHSVARAKALLDLYGYTDKNGDGLRDLPDGKPLVLEYTSQPDQQSKQLQELWRKAMGGVGVKIEFKTAKWPENLKASRAGKLMMWGVAWGGVSPDGGYFLDLMNGAAIGQSNHSRINLPAINTLLARIQVLPDGAEREALMREVALLGVAYMPYKVNTHRIVTDLMHPQVVGYRRHPFMREFWRYVDIDTAVLEKSR